MVDPANPDVVVLVQQFHSLFRLDRLRVVAGGRVPDGEEDQLLAVGQLLDAEITHAETAGHEVRAGGALFHRQLVVERRPFRGRIPQMHASAGNSLERLVGDAQRRP